MPSPNPITRQPGTFYAAPEHAPTDRFTTAWVAIGTTDPRYCSVDGQLWQFGLSHVNMAPAEPIQYTQIGWESDDHQWRLAGPFQNLGHSDVTRFAVPIWPIFAMLDPTIGFERAT
jgi:hypothetical protein